MTSGRALFAPCAWETRKISIGTTVQEITASFLSSTINDISTLMIQAASANSGIVYFGSDNTITSSGTGNIGGTIASDVVVILPVKLSFSSKLYMVSSSPGQTLYVSIFDSGFIR